MENNAHRLFVSVDMDDWYFSRWATGSEKSIWKDLPSCYREIYKSETPPKRLVESVQKILDLFDELNFHSTFFITGYVAFHFRDLVKTVSERGHEIACHNYHHIDYRLEKREKFRSDLGESKALLEDITGKKVIGYRSPNSSIPESLAEDLLEFGFKYDSSVTPTSFMSYKSGDNSKAPRKPYHTDSKHVNREGNSALMEFPWAIFPVLKLPAGSGILHRVAGDWYNNLAVKDSLEIGHTSYYFHPYEVAGLNEIAGVKLPLKAKIFLRRIGEDYFKSLKKFLIEHQNALINGERLLELLSKNN